MSSSTDSLRESQTSGSVLDQISSGAEGMGVSEAHPVDFPQAARSRSGTTLPLERFAEVNIEISVEIGRVTMPIGDLLQLGEGAVVELNRSISEPVDIMAQGVRIASGEVVVIDDRFAVRITEIASADEGREKSGRSSIIHDRSQTSRR